MAHTSFAVKLCLMQSKSGRKCMIEQPVGTRAWGTQLMNKLLFEKGVGKVNFDFDKFEMKSAKEREVRLARKRTSIISNSQALLKELAKYQTSGRHQHATTREWKTTACHMYNNEFCKTVCETIMKEKNSLDNTSGVLGGPPLGPSEAKDITGTINELTMVDPHEQELLYDTFEFFDDVTGQTLDKKMSVEARKLEMQFFRNMKVYDKVPRWMAARDGCKVITTKCRDINKGNQRNPNYRARLDGREIKTDSRLDLFAATPPLESLRVIWSTCASNQDRQDPYRIMSRDVRRAYFHAKATRPVHIEIPIEDFEPGDVGKVARLNLTLYGTRDAAQNWVKEYTTFLEECGFKTGLASPGNFEHVNRELQLTVHGDDFTVTGPTAGLQWMQRRMEQKYEIEAHYFGPESGMKDEIQILNRTLRWTKEGITYEADQRHAEIVIKEMNMKKANAVSTPTVPEPSEEANSRSSSLDMTKDEASRFEGLVARVNYLSLDRPYLQFAAKTASQHMECLCFPSRFLPSHVSPVFAVLVHSLLHPPSVHNLAVLHRPKSAQHAPLRTCIEEFGYLAKSDANTTC